MVTNLKKLPGQVDRQHHKNDLHAMSVEATQQHQLGKKLTSDNDFSSGNQQRFMLSPYDSLELWQYFETEEFKREEQVNQLVKSGISIQDLNQIAKTQKLFNQMNGGTHTDNFEIFQNLLRNLKVKNPDDDILDEQR